MDPAGSNSLSSEPDASVQSEPDPLGESWCTLGSRTSESHPDPADTSMMVSLTASELASANTHFGTTHANESGREIASNEEQVQNEKTTMTTDRSGHQQVRTDISQTCGMLRAPTEEEYLFLYGQIHSVPKTYLSNLK
ncbi:hypothetical protein I316_03889 [Kwoniella heveanensis BCC8398]|uniref:Uncharacterized protein n=1 Tax=Kwoniella heveanensis BCC8398 TaxID=1296120 RepID=A0A1B9GU50_9TREE|nr:hypothetical protein I316_03889 [Kwoniella heveanensis BCC8398]